MERFIHEPPDDEARIDLTPMLDVVFIMLIFFIVTASFIQEVTLELDRPSPGKSEPVSERKDLVVVLQEDNQIVIEGRMIDHRAMRAYVERHLATHPQSAMIISARNTTKTFAVARVANAAREAGLYAIVLANRE